PSWVVSAKSGAGPIFERRASALASWPATCDATAPNARAASAAILQRREQCMLTLQLLLQLVEKPPVGAVGNQLLWAALHHPSFPQAERVEAHGLLGVVRSPAAER